MNNAALNPAGVSSAAQDVIRALLLHAASCTDTNNEVYYWSPSSDVS